jgi:hypothetical protein
LPAQCEARKNEEVCNVAHIGGLADENWYQRTYCIVGMPKSAPERIPVGQRVVMVLSFV